jgi:hypothetical protein
MAMAMAMASSLRRQDAAASRSGPKVRGMQAAQEPVLQQSRTHLGPIRPRRLPSALRTLRAHSPPNAVRAGHPGPGALTGRTRLACRTIVSDATLNRTRVCTDAGNRILDFARCHAENGCPKGNVLIVSNIYDDASGHLALVITARLGRRKDSCVNE